LDEAIARLNIAHFRKRLASESDPTKQQTIARLLSEEEARLKGLEDRSRTDGADQRS
jgi:hypothetical protein